ncbi:flagellar filament capping protein FliD [Desulfothermus sp.]
MALGSIYNAYPNGRPSGLPDDIVDQLVQVKQLQLLTPIQQDIQKEQAREDNYTSLSSKLVDLYKAADEIDTTTSFLTKTASSSDEIVLTADASNTAHTGNYTVTVNNIAKAHHLIIGVDDGNTSNGVTQGISNPDDANLIQDNVTISFYHNGKKYSYTTDSKTTLTNLANKISEDDNGVYAQVTNIGTQESPQYVLSLLSETTGSGKNQITTDSNGTTTGITLSDDLFTTGATEQEDAQSGEDASLNVDGVDYTRSSNEIDDIIEGVTINIKNTGTVNLNVSIDIDDITNKVKSLVDAYNNFDQFMDDNASYDLEDKKAAALLGDSIARTAQNNIRSIVSGIVPDTSDNAYQYLSQIGIEFNDDGQLTFDENTFKSTLSSNPDDVLALFTGKNGVATRLKNGISSYTDSSSGIITKTIRSIKDKINDLNDEYSDAQEDLKDYEEQMVKKYSNLEEVVLKYKAIQEQFDSYVEQWKSLNKG